MNQNTTASFFARMRQWCFDALVNWEIFNRIFPHLRGEKNCGYGFKTEEEVNIGTEQLNTEALLERVEQLASNMPKSYSSAFRHIMHRDLSERLKMYENVARRRTNRRIEPRYVAEHA